MSLSTTPTHSVPAFSCPNQLKSPSKCELHPVFCRSSPISDPKELRCTSSVARIASWNRCEYIDLHKELVPYRKAWDLQKSILREKKAQIERKEKCCDTLIVLQHNPVYTLGTGSSEEFLNFDIGDAPFDIVRTERGGQVTYHGPGQLVMYPIMNLRNHKTDLHWYLRNLEEVVIRTLSRLSIKASRTEGLTGVWVGDQKLAAMGIRVSQWITYHGLALNVSVDLSPFRQIVPCGIRDRGVASIKGILEQTQAKGGFVPENLSQADDFTLISLTHESLLREFAEVFQLQLEPRSLQL